MNLFKAVFRAAFNKGQRIASLAAYVKSDSRNPDKIPGLVLSVAEAENIGRLVLLPCKGQDREAASIIGRIAGQGVSVVACGMELQGVDSIVSDVKSGARALVRHIAFDHGLSRPGIIARAESETEFSRLPLFEEALGESGLKNYPVLLLNESPGDEKHIDEFLGQYARAVDSIMCSDDSLGLSVIAGLKKMHVDVPGDVAVTGFGGGSASAINEPGLTTVRHGFDEIAQKALDAFSQEGGERGEGRTAYVPQDLVLLESCGCARTGRLTGGFHTSIPVNAAFKQATLRTKGERIFRSLEKIWANAPERESGIADSLIFEILGISGFKTALAPSGLFGRNNTDEGSEVEPVLNQSRGLDSGQKEARADYETCSILIHEPRGSSVPYTVLYPGTCDIFVHDVASRYMGEIPFEGVVGAAGVTGKTSGECSDAPGKKMEEKQPLRLVSVFERFALTGREREVLSLTVRGVETVNIASYCRITKNTVEVHLHNIYKKLGVSNRVELINLINSLIGRGSDSYLEKY